jgi:hypothetical protein
MDLRLEGDLATRPGQRRSGPLRGVCIRHHLTGVDGNPVTGEQLGSLVLVDVHWRIPSMSFQLLAISYQLVGWGGNNRSLGQHSVVGRE